MASTPRNARQTSRQLSTDHEGFLRYRGFRWLKLSGGLCLVCVLGYMLADVELAKAAMWAAALATSTSCLLQRRPLRPRPRRAS